MVPVKIMTRTEMLLKARSVLWRRGSGGKIIEKACTSMWITECKIVAL